MATTWPQLCPKLRGTNLHCVFLAMILCGYDWSGHSHPFGLQSQKGGGMKSITIIPHSFLDSSMGINQKLGGYYPAALQVQLLALVVSHACDFAHQIGHINSTTLYGWDSNLCRHRRYSWILDDICRQIIDLFLCAQQFLAITFFSEPPSLPGQIVKVKGKEHLLMASSSLATFRACALRQLGRRIGVPRDPGN